jgi:hypoxanthine phosphoribosyltransferase
MEYTITELVSKEMIQQRVSELAKEISADFAAKKSVLPPVFICILNGSIHFFSDLVRSLDIDSQIDFIRLKSYEGQDNTGGVKVLKELELDLKGRHVYLVDDIIDSGETIREALYMILSRIPSSVDVVTLFQREGGLFSDFNGFVIQDQWIYGYGLDDNGLFRNISNIVYKDFKKD